MLPNCVETGIYKFLPASLRSVAKLGGTGASSTGSKVKWAAASEQAGHSWTFKGEKCPRYPKIEAINAYQRQPTIQNRTESLFAFLCPFMIFYASYVTTCV